MMVTCKTSGYFWAKWQISLKFDIVLMFKEGIRKVIFNLNLDLHTQIILQQS